MRKKRRSISLIELLMIMSLIAIIASIAIIAVNPVLYTRAARDASRWDDVNLLGNALAHYSKENAGLFPAPITEVPIEICGASKNELPCATERLLDISWLIPRYLLHIPSDPKTEYSSSVAAHSGYGVARMQNGALVISALNSEGGRIEIIREDAIHKPAPRNSFSPAEDGVQ
jgi:type II secretory pathway pseudopilin PulG